MFSFFRKKQETANTALPGAGSLTDTQLVQSILTVFKDQKAIVGALFLVAWENIPVYYPSFHKAMEEEKLFPTDFEGMSSFFAAEYSKHTSQSEIDEVARRRFFYFYVASLLKVAHLRAKANPDLWEQIVEVWVAILPGARALRATLDRTQLWRKEHTDFFDSIKTEDEGEWHVLHIVMPSNLRYHEKVVAWQERDLTPEQRRLIDETCNVFEKKQSRGEVQ
jgi:hypothetical protein